MQIDTLLHRGIYHSNYNEDNQLCVHLNSHILLSAVFDGCSSGKDSHFASALYKKILNNCSNQLLNNLKEADIDLAELSPSEIGDHLLGMFYTELVKMQELLNLSTEEILSTIIVTVYNSRDKALWLLVSGDGYYSINADITEVDQNNMPDFVGYHLYKTYEKWLNHHTQSFVFDDVLNYTISSDGIAKCYGSDQSEAERDKTIKLFMTPNKKSLEDRLDVLIHKKNYLTKDDISIIEVVG